MDRQITLVLVIAAVLLAPFIFFTVIRYVRADYLWKYKRFKKPVQTMGVIEWVECVDIPKGGSYYIITYSYTDNTGEHRIASFRWHERVGMLGSGIVIYFDSQDPASCIAGCQLEYGLRIWRIIYITLFALVVFLLFSLWF